MSTNPFKAGDIVECVDNSGGYMGLLKIGGIYTVKGVYGDIIGINEKDCSAFYWRFRPAELKIESGIDNKAPLKIEYSGIALTFDSSVAKSRMLVDAMLDVIYEDAKEKNGETKCV